MEIMSPKYRSDYGIGTYFGWSIGYLILPLFAWLLRDWLWIHIVITLPCFFLLSTWWLLPESPRWLLSQGRHEEALEVLSKAAKVNGVDLNEVDAKLKEVILKLEKESRSPEKLLPDVLRGGGLYARRPVVCVPLTRQHRTARLQWCREHHNWTEQDWAYVIFTDESRFSLSSDCRRQLIWRESGTAYRPKYIQEKDRYPTCSIMVWAGIMINGRTRPHVVANGTMTGQRYINEFLLPHVRFSRGAVGDKFVFMDDNATCHRTLAVQDCLDSEGIQRLVWPARSPDLNPIENVLDVLGRQVAGRNYLPTNKNTLIHALTEEWDKLPQQLLDNVVQSMVRRVECCITLHGGHIPY
ncbi:transposable element Tcb2 transposase [Trichonephila clavipes]|nr:transposable element Tcb2 transposase [Trichonephila clavipes]